jgi:hypothetical protein
MDRPYPGMRQRAADEGDILQACKPDIGHILAASAHEAIVLFPKQPRTDTLSGAGRCIRKTIAFIVRHQPPSPPDFAWNGYAATARGRIGATAS